MLYVPPQVVAVSWTSDRVELLIQYRLEGLTATQIAVRLGGVSRNAVIGKMDRLGMSCDMHLTEGEKAEKYARKAEAQRIRQERQNNRRERQRRLAQPRGTPSRSTLYQLFRTPEKSNEQEWRIQNSKEIDFLDLEPNHCRHPFNLNGPFKFCGCDKFTFHNKDGFEVESSYCEHHHNLNTVPARAYTPKARIYHGTNFSVWA